jgi:hypothetical protein
MKSKYTVLAYDHLHLQDLVVEKIQTGTRFSSGDVEVHIIFAGPNTGYHGTFIDWNYGTSYYLNGAEHYQANRSMGVAGQLCEDFEKC